MCLNTNISSKNLSDLFNEKLFSNFYGNFKCNYIIYMVQPIMYFYNSYNIYG